MPVPSRRLAVAGVIAAAVIAPARRRVRVRFQHVVRQAGAVRDGEQLRPGG